MKPLTFSYTDHFLLRDQLDSWRQRQNSRCRLPRELWDAAAKLAANQAISPVARAHRIDYYRLQRLTHGVRSADSVRLPANRFVELKLDVPRSPSAQRAVGWNAGSCRVIDEQLAFLA